MLLLISAQVVLQFESYGASRVALEEATVTQEELTSFYPRFSEGSEIIINKDGIFTDPPEALPLVMHVLLSKNWERPYLCNPKIEYSDEFQSDLNQAGIFSLIEDFIKCGKHAHLADRAAVIAAKIRKIATSLANLGRSAPCIAEIIRLIGTFAWNTYGLGDWDSRIEREIERLLRTLRACQ